jgi:hypothetical protein
MLQMQVLKLLGRFNKACFSLVTYKFVLFYNQVPVKLNWAEAKS